MTTEPKKIRVGVRGVDEKTLEIDVKPDRPAPWGLDDAFETVGKRTPRLDAVAKVTGRAKYTHDVNLPGMVYAKLVRSPHAAATVKSVDVAPAKALKGVVFAQEWTQTKEILFHGQHVAVVAAETRALAEEAARLVKVEYEVKPHAARMEQALADGAPEVFAGKPNRTGDGPRAGRVKDVDAALEGAAKVVRGTASTQVQTHSCLETKGVVAHWEADDKLKVWASTQGTFGVRNELAEAFGLKPADVTVLTHYMGGGFGSKFGAGVFAHAATHVAKALKRPVKLMLDRKEEHLTGGNRPNSTQEMTLGVDAEGAFKAYRVRIHATPGATGRGAGASNPMIYRFGAVDAAQWSVATNAGMAAAFRAPGHPQGSFALESILDLAAEALGMDPLELRKKNDPSPIRKHQYEEGAKLFGWEKRRPNGTDRGTLRRGMGVASAKWAALGVPGASCLCRVRRDGTVEIRNGAQDIGTGTRTIMAIVAAEELGIPLARVSSFLGDTNDPQGPGSGGSVTAPTIMPAARNAAFLAGMELRKLIAAKWGVKPEEIVLKGGKASHAADASRSATFEEVCALIDGDQIEVVGRRDPNFENYQAETGGVHFAEVEVDAEIGRVRVVRYLAMQDAGTIVDALTAESQVNGAIIQGISYALFEERHIDRLKGRQLNADLEGYKIAGPKDMPDVKVVLTDVMMGANNVGLAGLGEGPAVPPAAAIAGAVHNALGVRVWSLPMTPDRVLAALEGARK
ncbi:MAG TPA: xanthine dehydrogenase family protein molybdopterin-binding subunit [Planctomycetota bacterium]|nr:xanthine dehydrogenase family protein molybdopterin-binding subunit [Planctomycetota bacterium]